MEASQLQPKAYTHPGRIARTDGSSVTVLLEGNLHCETCHARGACGISEASPRQVRISDPGIACEIGEPVTLVLRKGLGRTAVFWAYVFPFLLMVLTLLAASAFMAEWLAGTLSLLVLLPYYASLYLLRGYFRNKFRIEILKN
ncbi:SoxR reducing system RseC family protein [Robiginitalea sp. SC105]|uniref:SoxR reducing system RseC family protein n=1 Tax=Robiginitalea sp. SC105 TaxID=2762332 RepID=UPI0016399852|nr:SoxR reducing system RseC family protein [Robiginitalea sp. SC105]MBC2837881.1 SoxR reducing system RseC family protein [Robiginitalea sp. SC105]